MISLSFARTVVSALVAERVVVRYKASASTGIPLGGVLLFDCQQTFYPRATNFTPRARYRHCLDSI